MSKWSQIAQIAPGGTILDSAMTSAGELLLVSSSGLLIQDSDDWRLLMRGIPFWQLNCTAVAEKTTFAAGIPTSIIRSFDGGVTWITTFIDQETAPIMKIVPSPNYTRDRIMLAATDIMTLSG